MATWWIVCGLPGSVAQKTRSPARRSPEPVFTTAGPLLVPISTSPEPVETATDWTRLDATRRAVESALRNGLADVGEAVVPFTHLSHVYPAGSSIYTTYLFRTSPEPGETLRRWTLLKEAVSRAVLASGATISHQHGVGVDHRAFLEPEKGPLGLGLIRRMAAELDPDGILNPGKLVS